MAQLQKVIRAKLGVAELAKQLGNVGLYLAVLIPGWIRTWA